MAPSRVPHFGGKSFEVEIRPLASKNPVCLPRKKDVRWCRVGFCILAYYRGASCLPACPCTLVGQDGAPWGAPPTTQQAIPSMLVGCWVVRLSGGRAEASSVTLSSRKDVVLGEAFRGIAVARRAQAQAPGSDLRAGLHG
ncbi:unnamed protein product [Lupinus luteus]|uniref:Uncharacterized protein n=1 Tax=Lupinus luteus TaxID=3873 RepID=A0AAV1VYL6_LUPLU